MKQEEVAEKMGKIGYFESPLAGPLPPSRMGPAYSPCPFWPLLPLGLDPFDPFDPSGLFGLFGPFCLYLQYQRRRDPSLCLSLIQCLCLYRPEEEHVDRGGPLLVCVRGHYRQ